MKEYIDQIQCIIKANSLDFQEIVYPVIIESDYDPVDKTDFLAVIKDLDIAKYNYMDTAARDDLIDDICNQIFKRDSDIKFSYRNR